MRRVVTDFSEPLVLVAGGVLLSSSFFVIHLISTFNPYHKMLVPMLSISASGLLALYIGLVVTELSPILVLRESMSAAIVGIFSLLPLITGVVTLYMLRITLLTNRSVGATS